MAKAMNVTEITPELLETIVSSFSEDEKRLTRQIVDCFLGHGFSVKVKQYYQPCMKGTYRILCFIKKSSEQVIINNRGMGRDGVSFQVRIGERSTLQKLHDFSENIRNQIVNAAGCSYCSSKCEGQKYVFEYQGKEYTKCRFLCNNFTFQNVKSEDIDDLMKIINIEISRKARLNPIKELRPPFAG
ncbi:MAG: hypothetical protein ACI4XQ_03505 [Eubacteriales bacterium]